ncbi:MAG: FAD-dependent oxidoreductase [Candidatus Wolfebacteria bacterium]|nr:FAD-dependent oxidoreductase [Candidatus Wolfebacteria bacterium]
MTIPETENNRLILKEKKEEANDVVTLKFCPKNGELPDFRAGQFVMVGLANKELSGITKSYTISSAPGEKLLSITVKRKGSFSQALYDLKVGGEIKASEPQGFFFPSENSQDIVFLAGGIGITPFYSIIKDTFKKNPDKKIHLFYSNKTLGDIAFLKDLDKLSAEYKNLRIIHLLTREQTRDPRVKEFKRLDADILKRHLGDLSRKDYFICGSIGFVNDLWRELKKAGVKEEEIFTEAFF